MTAPSPHSLVSHNGPSFEDEDQVVFKTPSEKNGTPNVSTFRQSSYPSTSQRSFGENGQVNGTSGQKTSSPASAGPQWNMSHQFNDADQGWNAGDGVGSVRNSDEAGDHHANDTGALAPAAEIKEQVQPHSRQSSAGDSSSFDSPAIPTPGNSTKPRNGAVQDKPAGGPPFSPQNGYQYGYDQDVGIHQVNGINGMMNGHMSPPMVAQGMYNHPMSPLMGASAGPGAFSPQMMLAGMQPDSRQAFGAAVDGFSVNYGIQARMNGRAAIPGRTSNGAANAAFPTLNGQQQQAANGAAFAYGSPPNQSALAYNAGLMSPTLTSPTFLQNNPYSPIHAPTPYSPYAGNPQGLAGAGSLYDIMSPMSPPATTAALANRVGLNQIRGHNYSVSQPTALRDAAGGMGAGRPNQGRPGGQGQAPRGPLNQLNHAHSMSMSQVPYSPQLTGIPYGAMSPPPFPGYYPQAGPQQQPLSPELIQAMAGLAVSAAAANSQAGAAYNPQVQSALQGLQQDPAVLALIQQGGGPSANNRKLGLYKTELCRSWEEKGSCKYGEKCQFAHGEAEQRRVERHPKYKTEICRTFWVSGSCPYGKRCCFIHTELPGGVSSGAQNGAAEGQRSTNTPNNAGSQNDRNQSDGRARSMSTNSDPNEHTSSLLARISARAQANNSSSPVVVNNRSGEESPTSGSVPESVIASAIARAYSAYGMPASAAALAVQNHQGSPVDQSIHIGTQQQQQAPPPPQQQPPPQAPSPSGFQFTNRTTSTPSGGGLGGGHHRVSASMDWGRQGRNLGSELSGLGSGLGHQRNPSASSVVPGLSRTPISGQSTPFGGANESSSTRGIAVGSSLLDSSPW